MRKILSSLTDGRGFDIGLVGLELSGQAKVIEAAAAGIPVVASALLVRQLEWRDGTDVLGARDARTAWATRKHA